MAGKSKVAMQAQRAAQIAGLEKAAARGRTIIAPSVIRKAERARKVKAHEDYLARKERKRLEALAAQAAAIRWEEEREQREAREVIRKEEARVWLEQNDRNMGEIQARNYPTVEEIDVEEARQEMQNDHAARAYDREQWDEMRRPKLMPWVAAARVEFAPELAEIEQDEEMARTIREAQAAREEAAARAWQRSRVRLRKARKAKAKKRKSS